MILFKPVKSDACQTWIFDQIVVSNPHPSITSIKENETNIYGQVGFYKVWSPDPIEYSNPNPAYRKKEKKEKQTDPK